MIGQKKLLTWINSFTIDTFPKTSLILGEVGSGKHLLSEIISAKLGLPLLFYTDISLETLTEIQLRSSPSIYVIDGDSISEREQNIILKFIEEPLANAFILILSSSKCNLLDTIINRCITFELEQYSYEELTSFIEPNILNKDLVFNICRTPGQLLSLQHVDFNALYTLCEKIVTRLKEASFVNTLSISDKLNYKDEFDKFDVILFFDTLSYVIYKKYLETRDSSLLNIYLIAADYRNKMNNKLFSKEALVNNFLTKLWMCVNNG